MSESTMSEAGESSDGTQFKELITKARLAPKPRVRGIIANLPKAQQDQIWEWLLQGLTYKQAGARMKEVFNVSVGTSSLCEFYKKRGIAAMSEQQQGADAPIRLKIELTLPKLAFELEIPPSALTQGQ